MDDIFTLDDLAQFTREEQELSRQLGLPSSNVEEEVLYKPSQSTVNNLLNYSKALSVRSTENHGTIEMVLN